MPDPPSKKLSNNRRLLFKIISVFLSLSILLFAELGLRLFSYGGSMRLFVDHRLENYEDYYIVNPFVGLKYFNQFKATEARDDIFLKQKPDNGFRIFVLGSSTVYGFPYEQNLMATRILHKRLQDAFPDRTIEVINTSITAINTVTLRDFSRQIVKYEPDAILVYAGHNEFYGAFGVGSNERMIGSSFFRAAHFRLVNLRLYQLMQAAIRGITDNRNGKSAGPDQKGTLMKRIVKDKEIAYDSDKYKQGVEQFEDNLTYILDLASKNGIPVFLSDLVCNVKDISPFGDSGNEDQSALFHYNAAKDALSTGDTMLAKELFYTAKDLDPVRFRASEEINQIIYSLAKEKGAMLVPVKEQFAKASPGGIIGNDLLTEHVHPNIDGQFLLADVFYNSIISSGLAGKSPDPLSLKFFEHYRRNWGYTALDSIVGEFKVMQLKSYWPYRPLNNEVRFRDEFKPEGVVENFAFSVITDPDASVEALHQDLAEYYEKNSAFVMALKENYALVCMYPYWSDYLNNTANSLFYLNDLYKAEKYLRESLKYTPTYFAQSMLGEIEFIKHDYENALSLYEKAYKIAENESLGIESRVFMLSRLYYLYHVFNLPGKKQKIRTETEKFGQSPAIPPEGHAFEYSRYIPYNIEAEFSKAVSHSGSDIDSSQYYLERCLAINDCPVVNLYLGDILYQKQDLNALQYYQKAYDAYNADPSYLIRLFYAYFVSVNKTRAEETLNRLKKIDPSNSEIPRLQTLLSALQ